MQGNARLHKSVFLQAPAGTIRGTFKLPYACTLRYIQHSAGVASSDSTLKVGTSADDDGIMTAGALSATSFAATFFHGNNGTHMDGALYTGVTGVDFIHFAANTQIEWVLSIAGGTDAVNYNLEFEFEEG